MPLNSTLSDTLQRTIGDSLPNYQAMNVAKQEREEKKLQMLKMEARIKKLQVEEEKAHKRINEARK